MEELSLTIKRKYPKENYTIGKLFINGEYFCDTLEDKDRGLTKDMSLADIKSKKVYGETAIPKGKYFVTMKTQSPKYSQKENFAFTKGYMPRILDVPGWEGVLIHTGNTSEHSLGCVLVGKNTEVGKVTNSMATFKKLYPVLKDASDLGKLIILTIE